MVNGFAHVCCKSTRGRPASCNSSDSTLREVEGKPHAGDVAQLMEGAAVSLSRVAQWPSHRAPSVGTFAFIILEEAVVSLSRAAMWPSHRASSLGTQLAMVRASRSIQAPSHSSDPKYTTMGTTISGSHKEPRSAPSTWSSPASLAWSRLARDPVRHTMPSHRPRHHRPLRLLHRLLLRHRRPRRPRRRHRRRYRRESRRCTPSPT